MFFISSYQHKISDIKAKIQELKSFEVSTQKLIHKGKPAEDGATVEALGLKEGDFMVIMVSKVY